jgi:hypothetical protein
MVVTMKISVSWDATPLVSYSHVYRDDEGSTFLQNIGTVMI